MANSKSKTNEQVDQASKKSSAKSTIFQKELKNILSILIKENSIDKLTEEFLVSSINFTKSSFGIIYFTDNRLQTDNFYKLHDKNRYIEENESLISEVKQHLNYILKWLSVNKKILSINSKEYDKIGYGLIDLFQQKHIAIVPCIFENSVLAVIIYARPDEYSSADLKNLEQLTAFLSLAINNSVNQNINSTLENKLLQSQKLETIGKLASGMAHDFNNLLSSIFGSLNLLRRKLSDRPDVEYLLGNIESCSRRAADLSKGLLSYGKPTPKRKTLIKPNNLLHELTNVVEQTFPGNIKIEKKISSSLYDIMGNATEIYQVLLNLCINGKEAIKDEGLITIECKNFTIDDRKKFDFPLLEKGKYVCFSISDSGEGISEANLSKIFDPYFSTKQKDTGSGLGLYVAYGIIKAHNGYIDVTSKVGKGTSFDIYIPAFEKELAEKHLKTEKIILLADDEFILRDLLAELLESYNYNVICVQNGIETLKILTEEIKVDLLVIDFKMPELDGVSCIKKIRELNFKLPIILSSGSSSVNMENLEELNINCILNKPYEFEQMLEEVRKLI